MLTAAFTNRFFTLGWACSWKAIYLAELFTSTVRATAASFVFNATRLVAWVFPILAGTMIQVFGGIQQTAMILGSIYAIGLVVPRLLPETRNGPLPE